MGTLTVEVDDKGNIGTLPPELQKFFDTRVNDAFGRGAKKVEEELRGKLADPAQIERLKLLDEENSRLKEAEARAKQNFEEADRLKEERYQKQLAEKDTALAAKETEIARRETRLRSSLGSEIRAAAVAAGARDESLPELVKLLGADLELDPETLEPFVKGADGKPLTKDGKPVSIEGHVAQYLTDHPHHLAGKRGQSGRAKGGASLTGGSSALTDKDSAVAAAEEAPTRANVNAALGSLRKPK